MLNIFIREKLSTVTYSFDNELTILSHGRRFNISKVTPENVKLNVFRRG